MSEPLISPSPVTRSPRAFDRESLEHLVAQAEVAVDQLRRQVEVGRQRLDAARASHHVRLLEARSGGLVLAAQRAIEEDARRHHRIVAALASTAESESESILLAACRQVEALAEVVGRRGPEAATTSTSEPVFDLTDPVSTEAVAL